MNTKEELYIERHRKMLDYQRTIKPVPPMRDLEELWGLASTSAVDYFLRKLERRGWVKTVPKGNKYKQYIAVEVEDASCG